MRRPISTRVRYQIFERDGFACQYCGAKAPNVILHIDHDIPVSKGGSDKPENLKTACSACNQGKGDLMPSKAKEEKPVIEQLKHPLIGWAFLSYTVTDDKHDVQWQGIIRHVVGTNPHTGDCAVVDFFDWIMGDYSYSQLIPLVKFSAPHGAAQYFKLFPSLEDQKDYYARHHGRRSDRDDF